MSFQIDNVCTTHMWLNTLITLQNGCNQAGQCVEVDLLLSQKSSEEFCSCSFLGSQFACEFLEVRRIMG